MMVNNQSETEFENKRLSETIALAEHKLTQARQTNEANKAAIIAAKKELRENTSHSISSLWSSEGFEALAELSQDVNPVVDKIIDYEEVENKISHLETLKKSPYFARIDFRFDDEDSFEKIYIGRCSLKHDNTHEIWIYDWRSPIASVFYRFVSGDAFYDAPGGRITGELNLKRQYEINNGTLEYFFDADIQIVDEFLRQLLSQNSSSKMKAIVETIQKDQDIVIRDMENDLMMVQGVAGSGKTSIALHRAAYLMYQGLSKKLSANNIIIISPNSLFEQYISDVLPELGENNVVSTVFEEILSELLPDRKIQSKNEYLENFLTSSKHYHQIMAGSIKLKTSRQFLKILDRFVEEIPLKYIEFEDVYYEGRFIIGKEILRKRVSGRPETLLGIKLKQLEDFILESICESENERISKAQKALVLQEIRKYTEPDLLALYITMLSEAESFYNLSGDLNLAGGIEDIWQYTKENLDSGHLYYDDAIVLACLSLKIYGTDQYKNIRQTVIDEAQDYYPMQYEIFHLLFPNSKFTILGDVKQTLEKQESLSMYHQIRSILNKKKSSLITMDKSFRCTSEILNYSLKFIDQNPDIKSFNRSGDTPKIHAASDETNLADMILTEINSCITKGYRSIGLIFKTERNASHTYENLKHKVEIRLITNENTSDLQGISAIPVYMSKGLEFDAVLICDTDAANYNSKEDKNLLYIACTRALHHLSLFYTGEISPLL